MEKYSNMRYKALLWWFLCSFIWISVSLAQNKYWVFLSDKDTSGFEPEKYFHAKALERRQKITANLYEYTDLPVKEAYIKELQSISGQTYVISRWFNAVSVVANQEQLYKIKSLPYVKEVTPVAKGLKIAETSFKDSLKDDYKDLVKHQIGSLQGELFAQHGIDGKGIRIAVFDAGFPGVEHNDFFVQLREEGRIIKTYDFVKKEENVYRSTGHGTSVLSCITGKYKGIQTGLATGAEFLLARTEKYTEPFSEEENWLAAVEWADKNGADIISSSLGYSYHRYFRSDMNGQTSLVSKAALLAARKGMIVINAMGNDGLSNWKVVVTPADTDSILSVGGIDPLTHIHIDFSSFGPTADRRMKPNVSAYGEVIACGRNRLKQTQGTSFSTPLVTGFVACVWQMYPEKTNFEIMDMVQKSGHLYPYYDYAHGYGMPQASYFFEKEDSIEAAFKIIQLGDSVVIEIADSTFLESNSAKKDYLYVHLSDSNGVLEKYAVVKVTEMQVAHYPLHIFEDNKRLRVFYKGYYSEFSPVYIKDKIEL